MRPFIFLKQSFQSQMSYRSNFLGSLVVLTVLYATRFVFIDSVMNVTPRLAGWARPEVMLILYFSLFIGVLVGCLDCSIYQFFALAQQGKIDPFIMKPVSVERVIFFRWSKPGNLLVAACLLLFFPSFYRDLQPGASFLFVALGFVTALVGAAVNLLVIATASLATLYFSRQVPVGFIFGEVYRLSQFPPELFPKPLRITFLVLLPVVFTATAPALVIARGSLWYLGYALVLAVLLGVIFKTALRLMIRRFDTLGG